MASVIPLLLFLIVTKLSQEETNGNNVEKTFIAICFSMFDNTESAQAEIIKTDFDETVYFSYLFIMLL